MPTISVIVPVYKVEPYLRRCVDSVLNQTYTDFELILVDDGSPDGCPSICEEYAGQDNRVRVIHQQNGGLSAARNAGIDWAFANSDSQWLSFIDSDDWVHPQYLEALLNAAGKTGCAIVVGGFARTTGEMPAVDCAALAATVWNTEEYCCADGVNAMLAWGKLYRRESFVSVRYPVGKIHEDIATTYKLLFQYEQIAVIDQPLYAYFQNENGIMGISWSPKRLDAIEALEERAQYFKERDNDRMCRRSLASVFSTLLWHLALIDVGSQEKKAEYKSMVMDILIEKYEAYGNIMTVAEARPVKKTIWMFRHPRCKKVYLGLKKTVKKIIGRK